MPGCPAARSRTPLLVAVLALLWGSGFLWVELALRGLAPAQVTVARLLLAALALGAVVAARRLPVPRDRRTWAHLAVAALVANAVPYTLFAVAQQSVTSSLAGTINATSPLWTALIAAGVGVERLTPVRTLGLGIGFAGAVVVLAPGRGGAGDAAGLAACAGAALSYGVAYVYQARHLTGRGVPPLVLAFCQTAAATGLVALTLPVAGRAAPRLTGTVVAAVLVLGLLGTGLAYVVNFTLIASEGPTAASVVSYLLPAVAVALGAAVLAEPVGADLLAGGALVLLGVGLVQRR